MTEKSNVVEFDGAGANDLNDPKLVEARKELVDSMKRAEEAVRRTMGGTNMICMVGVSADEDDEMCYVGHLTLIERDGQMLERHVIGDPIDKQRDWCKGVIDARAELAQLLRCMAGVIEEHIEGET